MKLKEYLTPFFFGFIGILAFAPFSFKPLIILSYTYLIKELSFKSSSTRQLIMWSIGHWGFGMSWLIVSVYYYGETSIVISLIIFFFLIVLRLRFPDAFLTDWLKFFLLLRYSLPIKLILVSPSSTGAAF